MINFLIQGNYKILTVQLSFMDVFNGFFYTSKLQ